MSKRNDLYGFSFLTGDVNYLDYGGTWIRHSHAREYHVISLINWEDSVGECEALEIGATYCMDLSVVDLDTITADKLSDAMISCGYEDETRVNASKDDRWLVEVVHAYGLQAPVDSVNTSNFHKTFKALSKHSRELSADADAHEAMMERPVNALGSTAREFMSGDLTSAMLRGTSTAHRIVRKMYGIPEELASELREQTTQYNPDDHV